MRSRRRGTRLILWLLAGAAVAGAPAGAQSLDGVPDTRFIEQRERFAPAGGAEIDLRFLITRDAAGQATRIVTATHAALSQLSDWFGPLPSPALTVAAMPWRASVNPWQPGIAAAPVRWLAPTRDQSTERALIGALVRQYWSATTSTPFEDAVTIYISTRAIHALLEGSNFAAPRFFGGFVPMPLRSVLLSPPAADPRPRFWGFEELEPPGGTSDEVKHAVRALQLFERYAGWPTTLQALSRIRVGPGRRDVGAFAAALSDARGTDMRALVARCFNPAGVFQYSLDAMQSQPGPSGLIETTLTISRRGDQQFTIGDDADDRENAMPLLVRFADGTEVRDYFDGAMPAVTMVYSAKTAAAGAWIDPDLMLLLDHNRENHAIVRDAPTSPLGLRLALHWMAWLQNAMLSYTAII